MNVPFYAGSLAGKVVEGLHKRGGSPTATVIKLEVTAIATMVVRGRQVPYLFGTRLDGNAAGNVNLVRADCFKPDTVIISEAQGFRAIDLAGWMVTPNSSAFVFIEKIEEPELIKWAVSLGGRPLCDYVK